MIQNHVDHVWIPDGIDDLCEVCGLPAPAGSLGITHPTSSCPGKIITCSPSCSRLMTLRTLYRGAWRHKMCDHHYTQSLGKTI